MVRVVATSTALLWCLLFPATASLADPSWLHPGLTKEECARVSWRTQASCFQEFYQQQIRRYEDFVRFELGLADADGCKGVTEAYLEREAAWEQYEAAACALQTYCVGSCGSGHSASSNGCRAGLDGRRYERLQDIVRNGIEIWGCPLRPNERLRRFESSRFDLVLQAACPDGRFGCDQIELSGEKKETGESIELMGRELLMGEPEYPHHERFKGYVFRNGDLTYRLLTAGRLIVEDEKRSQTLVDEEGKWMLR